MSDLPLFSVIFVVGFLFVLITLDIASIVSFWRELDASRFHIHTSPQHFMLMIFGIFSWAVTVTLLLGLFVWSVTSIMVWLKF